jgi:NitT/TauT family transport system permease protein
MTASTSELGVAEYESAVTASAPAKAPSTIWWRVLGYTLFLGTWQALSTFVVAQHILPSPITVGQEIYRIATEGDFLKHFGATMQRTFIALPIVFVLGAAVGTVMGLSKWWESFFRDIVTMLLSLPGLILVLIFVLIFGLNPIGPILAIVLTNFGFVSIQVWEGVKALPSDLVDMAAAFDVSRKRLLRHIVLPALAPYLFTAFTYAFTLTWKLAMLSELFGGNAGVGYRMRIEFWEFSVSGVLAWALMLFAILLAVERLLLSRIERAVFRWRTASFD